MDKKKIMELIGSIFIAFIFLSSYATMSSSPQNRSTKPTTTIPMVIGTGFAPGKIINYTQDFTVTAHCSANVLNATLGKLQAAGAVAEFVPLSNSSFEVYSGNESSYALMHNIANMSSCFNISATAIVSIPSTLNLYISALNRTFSAKVPASLSLVQIPIPFSNESKVNLSIMALATLEGTVYQPNVTIYNLSAQVEK